MIGGHELEPLGLGLLQMADSCEYANEHSDSIKWGEFFCLAEKLFAFQEVLGCTGFVVTFICMHYERDNQSVSVSMLADIMLI